jgi:bifunctional oligoribonuclease and PAP phosphatase NrnA
VNDLQKILEVILASKRILVTSHENPDADAIGSMLSVALSLNNIGKLNILYNKDGVPDNLKFLPGSSKVRNSFDLIEGDFDCTIIVDSTNSSRVGNEFQNIINSRSIGTLIIIDHHQTKQGSGELYLINPESSSTGMIIYTLIKSLNVEVTSDIAINLYTSIIGDTGSFRYSNTHPETFRVAAELVEYGANPAEISQALYESEKPEKLRLIGLGLSTLEIAYAGRIASIVLKKEMYAKTGTHRSDTEGIINLPRSIKGIEVAILFTELENNNYESIWKVSLRSKGEVDVARIAERFCGGGHKRAAGLVVKGSLEEVKKIMYETINQAFI